MRRKEDLRIRRTHKLLCNAMFSLLETRSFDDISVVDICEKAMVHRATFYKHFKDKRQDLDNVRIKGILDGLVKCGVKGLMNFAYTELNFDKDIAVENVHLSDTLMTLSYKIKQNKN